MTLRRFTRLIRRTPSSKEVLHRLDGDEPVIMHALQQAVAKNRPQTFRLGGRRMRLCAWDHDGYVIQTGWFGRHHRDFRVRS